MIGLVATNVLEIVPWTSNLSCQAVAGTYDLLQLVTYIIWAVISAIRIYVVSKGKIYLSVVVFCLAIVPFATNMYSSVMVTYAAVEFAPSPPFCDPTAHFSMAFDNRALIASRTCAIAADVIVLLTTWYNAPRSTAVLKRAFGSGARTPFLLLLLRDGALYFIVLLLITVAQIVVNSIEALSLGTVFLVPAMSVLVSRFLLDIYQAAENAVTISGYDHDSSTEFTRDTGLEFEMPDVECRDTTIGDIFSFPTHFTDSGLG